MHDRPPKVLDTGPIGCARVVGCALNFADFRVPAWDVRITIPVDSQEVSLRLACGPYTETNEFRKLPEALQTQVGYVNTIRFLFGERRGMGS